MVFLAAGLTAVVIAGFWLLDQVDLIPFENARTWLARIALLPIALSAAAAPSAFQSGLEWFVERKTNEILEQIEPMLPPPATTIATRAN